MKIVAINELTIIVNVVFAKICDIAPLRGKLNLNISQQYQFVRKHYEMGM